VVSEYGSTVTVNDAPEAGITLRLIDVLLMP
jgi:hypothetical protein